VIEDLSSHPEKRRRFLRSAGIDGVALAVSLGGGAAGERELPLVKADEDWDVLTTRALELVRELDSEELARLLHALAEACQRPSDPWSKREANALTREVLAATTARLVAPDLPVSLIEAWLRAAARAEPPPEPPSLAHVWAHLVPSPPFDDATEISRADDWLTLAWVLWRYRRRYLAELGFPDRYDDVLAALVDAGRRSPDDPVLSRALLRLARLAPSVRGLMPVLPELEDEERVPREPAWEPPPVETFTVASVLRDL
jgi:hypothetical protein